MSNSRLRATTTLAALLASRAAADWTVTSLHPPGASRSLAWAVSDGQQVGRASVGGNAHASLWTGSAASWVDLTPAGSSWSECYDVRAGRQVGSFASGGIRACFWSGTPESVVELHPDEASESYAFCVLDGLYGGCAALPSGLSSLLWIDEQGASIELPAQGSIRRVCYCTSGAERV